MAVVAGGAGGLIDIAMGGGVPDTLDAPSPDKILQRMVVLAVAGLANAGCAVGTYSWQRWGIYGVVCASLLCFMVNMRVGGLPVAVPGVAALGALIVFVIALWPEFD